SSGSGAGPHWANSFSARTRSGSCWKPHVPYLPSSRRSPSRTRVVPRRRKTSQRSRVSDAMIAWMSPLQTVHEEAGARMTDFAGWQMPLRFSSDRAEHEAVRTRAGVFDLSHMAQIEVNGPQAGEVVDYSFVGPPSTLSIGRARYTMMVDTEGGILDDLIVYRLAPEDYLIIANAANHQVVLDELTRRRNGYSAAVDDRGDSRALIALQGPRPRARAPGPLARPGSPAEGGFAASLPAPSAAGLWHRLLQAGGPAGGVPCGRAGRDSLRLEAGMALYGNELTRQITPADVGMGR